MDIHIQPKSIPAGFAITNLRAIKIKLENELNEAFKKNTTFKECFWILYNNSTIENFVKFINGKITLKECVGQKLEVVELLEELNNRNTSSSMFSTSGGYFNTEKLKDSFLSEDITKILKSFQILNANKNLIKTALNDINLENLRKFDLLDYDDYESSYQATNVLITADVLMDFWVGDNIRDPKELENYIKNAYSIN